MGIRQFLGVQARSSIDEKIISGGGAFIAILAVFVVTDWVTNFELAMSLLPSMGASAVLVLAVPHGTLSQPWSLFMGNVVSALMGVASASYIGNTYVAAGCAVGLAISAMHLLRCIHPPGGATALIAVVGGESVRDLGFTYVLMPTLINCTIIFLVACAFNNCFSWRRYPSSLMKYDNSMYSPETTNIQVRHLQLAMNTLDEVINIAPEQVKYIVDKADEIMRTENAPTFKISAGRFYTNGAAGQSWSVRQIIEISSHLDPARKQVIFRTVDGDQKGQSGTISLLQFRDWAREILNPAEKSIDLSEQRDAA